MAFALAAAAIAGAASYFGGQATNATNVAISQAQMQFQAAQQANQQAFSGEQSWLAYLRNNQTIAQAQDYDSKQAGIQRDFNAQMMYQAEGYDSNQAQIQRDYETQMSNTAYQRSVSDMKAAGLNPILGVASGGASTPSVASPTINPASASAPTSPVLSAPMGSTVAMPGSSTRVANSIGNALNSAFSAMQAVNGLRQTAANVDNTNAQTANLQAQTPGMTADSLTKALGPDIAKLGMEKTEAEIQNIIQQRTNLDATAAAALASAIASRAQAGLAGVEAGYTKQQSDWFSRNQTFPATMPGTYAPIISAAQGSLTQGPPPGSRPIPPNNAGTGVEDFLGNLGSAVKSWLAPSGNSGRNVGPPPQTSYQAPVAGGF